MSHTSKETKRKWARQRALDGAAKQSVYRAAVFFCDLRLGTIQKAMEAGHTVEQAQKIGEEFAREEFAYRNKLLGELSADLGILYAAFDPAGDAEDKEEARIILPDSFPKLVPQ